MSCVLILAVYFLKILTSFTLEVDILFISIYYADRLTIWFIYLFNYHLIFRFINYLHLITKLRNGALLMDIQKEN